MLGLDQLAHLALHRDLLLERCHGLIMPKIV
jgi:hypothetical protein